MPTDEDVKNAYLEGYKDGEASDEELTILYRRIDRLIKQPQCPLCYSKKLTCPNGHTWEVG